MNSNVLRFATLSLAILLVGCQPRTKNTGPTVRQPPTKPAASAPMTFSLCADGLPTTGMWKCDPVVADFNGDDIPDIAALPRLGNGPRVWLGDGKGSWTESSAGLKYDTASCGGGVAVDDINRDGYPDLAIGDHCQGVYVFLGDGKGNWRVSTKSLHPDAAPGGVAEDYLGAEDIDLGDVNSDGFLDMIAIAQDEGGVTLYLGDGTGSGWVRQESTTLPTKGWGNRVMFHDIDSDGFLDVIASMGEGPRVWLGNGKGEWTSSSKGLPTPMAHGLFGGVAVGDVNGDKRLDLAFANWVDGPEVFLQNSDGSWKETPDVFPDMLGGAIGIELGDIDQDGSLDMLVSGRYGQDVGYVYGLFVLKGNGHGGWQYLKGTNLPESGLATAWGVALNDINRDGILDLIYATGGVVATDPLRREAAVAPRVQVWCTQLTSSEKAVLAKLDKAP